MRKRIADWLEKISAGAMLIGLFQKDNIAMLVSVAMIVASLGLTRLER